MKPIVFTLLLLSGTVSQLFGQCTSYGTTTDIDFAGTCNETTNRNHNGSGTITISGDLSWSSGRFFVRGPVVVTGNLTFTGTGALRILVDGSLTVADGGTVTGLTVEVGANGSITIDEGGSMTATTLVNDWSGPATNNIVVNGDLNVSGSITNNTDGSFAGNGTITGDITDNGISTFTGTHTGTCTGNCGGTLPVKLVSFDAQSSTDACKLTWTTSTEINNSGFEVQKSLDGETFHEISFVEGNGNTTEIINYEFIDYNVSELAYYRLKQIDFDGAFEYSPIVYFQGYSNRQLEEIKLYPTYFNGAIHLSDWTGGLTDLEVISVNGSHKSFQNVLTKQDAEKHLEEYFNKTSTYSGVYYIKLRNGNQVWTSKIVK